MEQKIKLFVEKYHMLEKKDRIILGISGGADSVCLFFVLQNLKAQYELTIHLVHVNHQLRGLEADADQKFVEDLAKRYDVPLTVVSKDVRAYAKEKGLTEEEAGRKIRYDAFYETMQKEGANKIAVAHNMNDNAETMLFHLARGTGIKGMCGVLPVRENIIRPLLCVTRAEIEAYLSEKNESFCTDHTNFLDEYSRNCIRNHVLPVLVSEVNSAAVRHMSEMAERMQEVQSFLEELVEKKYLEIVCEKEGQYYFDINKLHEQSAVIQKELIRKVLFKAAGSQKDLESRHIEQILALSFMSAGKRISLPYSLTAIVEYELLRLGKTKEKTKGYEIFIEDGSYPIPNTNLKLMVSTENVGEGSLEIPKNDYTKWFDYDKIKQPILMRTRRSGDFLQINQAGGIKKLKDYFIDAKVPREERDNIPLLAEGNHIIWVLKGRISEKYKVSDTTKKILKVKIMEEKNYEH